jgi:hypothetical protein
MTEGLGIGGIGVEAMAPAGPPSDSDHWDDRRASVSLPNIPLPCPDQTLDSIAALTGLLNGLSPGRETIDRVFGSPNIKTDRAFHAGLRWAYGVLGGLGYGSYEQFTERHGFLPIFRPFVSAATYERAKGKLESNAVTGLCQLLFTNNFTMQRNAYHYCVDCAVESIQKRGYTYAHRTDQFQGVDFCAEHGTTLLTLAPGIRPKGSLAYGLIIPAADDDWRQILVPVTPLSTAPAWRALGVWVKAVLNGELPITSVELRTTVLQRQINEIPREPGDPSSPGGRCERHLLRTYGSAVLETLGLSVLGGVTRHWPAFLALGTAYTDHPLANLLVMSALFHSPAEFAQQVADFQDSGPTVASRPAPAARPRDVTLNLSILRAFYREPSIKEIARQRGLDGGTVESVLRLHPDLQQRREQFLERQLRRRMRRVVEAFLLTHPGANRTAVEEHNRNIFTWLMRHDRDWIDERIPTKRPPRPLRIANDDLTLIDARTQRRLADFAKQHLNNGGIERVTKRFLTQCLEPNERTMLAANRLPESEHQINALVESREAHLKRVERHLTSLIVSGDIQKARQKAHVAISAFGRQPDFMVRIIHAMIPDLVPVDSLVAVA